MTYFTFLVEGGQLCTEFSLQAAPRLQAALRHLPALGLPSLSPFAGIRLNEKTRSLSSFLMKMEGHWINIPFEHFKDSIHLECILVVYCTESTLCKGAFPSPMWEGTRLLLALRACMVVNVAGFLRYEM